MARCHSWGEVSGHSECLWSYLRLPAHVHIQPLTCTSVRPQVSCWRQLAGPWNGARREMWPHGFGCVWISWAGVGGRLVESGVCSSDMLELSDPSGAHMYYRCRGILAPSLARAHCPWLVLCSQRWLEAACFCWLTAGNLILEASAYAWGISTHGLMSWRGACWCFQLRNPSEAFGVGSPGPWPSGVT